MAEPTILAQRYLILPWEPKTAQALALECEHEWRDIEPEDEGVGLMMVMDGELSRVRPCKHCVAAVVVIAGRDGKEYSGVVLRDAADDSSAGAE